MTTPVVKSDSQCPHGKARDAGTRIPVELILEKLAAGETLEQIV